MEMRLAFHPKQHGFHFKNNFTNHVVAFGQTLFETHGLCGGMSAAVLDYYKQGMPIPTHGFPFDDGEGNIARRDFGTPDGDPPEGSRLRDYLLWRQLTTLLRFGAGLRFIVPPLYDNPQWHQSATATEFGRLQNHLGHPGAPGDFALLGLYGVGDLFHGHQVLAYGWSDDPEYSGQAVWVYDSNHPDHEAMLQPIPGEPFVIGVYVDGALTNDRYKGWFMHDEAYDLANPERPVYVDLGLSNGIVASAQRLTVGDPLDAAMTMHNFGDYPAHFSALDLFVRDPSGANVDYLLGGSASGDLAPGVDLPWPKHADHFVNSHNEPGDYHIGAAFALSDFWYLLPAIADGTTNGLDIAVMSGIDLRGWRDRGGPINSTPAVGTNADGHLEVFVLDENNSLAHICQQAATDPEHWSPLAMLRPEHLFGDPQVVRNRSGDDRLEVFVRSGDNQVRHLWQRAANASDAYDGWDTILGTVGSDPTVVINPSGRIEFFARGQASDNAVHAYERVTGGLWSGIENLGDNTHLQGKPSAAVDELGRVHVVVRWRDNAICEDAMSAPEGGWLGWLPLNGAIGSYDPVVTPSSSNTLMAFVRGTGGLLWWTTLDGSGWSPWQPVPGSPIIPVDALPAGLTGADGQFDVFLRGPEGDVLSVRYGGAAEGWSAWESLGGRVMGNVAVGRDINGQLHVFGRDANNSHLVHIYQSDGRWSGR